MNQFAQHNNWTKLVAGLLFINAVSDLFAAKHSIPILFNDSPIHAILMGLLPLVKLFLGYQITQHHRRAILAAALLYLLQLVSFTVGSTFIGLSDYRALGIILMLPWGKIAIDASALVMMFIAITAYRFTGELRAKNQENLA
ncbi:hypothetical protein [Gallaecimonas mangrovi]|uniref:hypothetical protein n=1 Tax=Gallaecimonas mangrovi TaxID=2291597 RepID=UPI0012603996|nr:hypothetical protein [Gallaecimonas mangrovi]